MTKALQTDQDCHDFISGCLFMGTGGGGDPKEGTKVLLDGLRRGLELRWVDPSEIDDDVLTATSYLSGSIAPRSAETDALIESLQLGEPTDFDVALTDAVRCLGQHLGQPIGCLVPVELGASNSPQPIVAAATLGIPVVDGDYSGRAVPDEMQGTPFINEIHSHPFASVDAWGNTAIVTTTANPYMLERVSKMLSIAGIDGTAIASTPIDGRTMKRIVVPGTLSKCLRIGRAITEANNAGHDPVDAAVEAADGWRLFDGVVTEKRWEDRDGYMFGTLAIEGVGRWSGRSLRAWFKNENHVTWLDGEPWVCSPDLVTLVSTSTARGYTTTVVAEGDHVSAVGMRGLDVFRTPAAVREAAGPPYFGFDEIEYRPIEELMVDH